jgi:ankyrin repeat protein
MSFFTSDLSKYNMADHMLRYSISKAANIRVIAFFLCVAGADPNSQDRWLRTPLHFAAAHNRPDVVRLLLLSGADTTVPGALVTPQHLHHNYSMATPDQLIASAGAAHGASYFVLRGKSCLSCNLLLSSDPSKKARCPSCSVALCSHCIKWHKCVWMTAPIKVERV